MTSFRHTTVDRAGNVTQGIVQTTSRDEALRILTDQGLTPISVQRQLFSLQNITVGRRSTHDLLSLFDQLGTLLDAGVPLAESLGVLADRPGTLGKNASQILGAVRQGSPFGDALKNSGFSPSAQNLALIKIGEETATLGHQLSLISEQMKQSRQFEQDLISGLIYPAVLGVMLIATIFFLAHFILPQFEEIFTQDGITLPSETELVLTLGSTVREWGWALPLAFLMLIGAINMAKRIAPQWIARAVHRTPMIGSIAQEADLARFCRALGTLLHSNTPIATALPLATSVVSNVALRHDIDKQTDRIRLGDTAQSALGTFFPADARALLDVGERTGQLAELLLRSAALLETRVRDRIRRLVSFIGPSLTILMGGMVAFVIAGVMMGVLGLNDLVQ